MSEIDQLKQRIDNSGETGVFTAHIRDDYEPVGAEMIHDICANGEYVQRQIKIGSDYKWKIFKEGNEPKHDT